MSLINCPECSREVSDKAESCPNCGFVLKSKSSIETKKSIGCLSRMIIYVFGFIIIVIIIQSFGSKKTEVQTYDPQKDVSNIVIPSGCKKHIEVKDTKFWAKELMTTPEWVQNNHKLNIWENGSDEDRGDIVGKIIPGSKAVIVEENKNYYKIQSPYDNSIGWINKIQVKRTIYQNTETLQSCKP